MTVAPGHLVVLPTPAFEGLDVPAIEWNGIPIWPIGKVATALGYEDTYRISVSVRTDWKDELVEGEDFVKVESEGLRPFKDLGIVGPNANAALFLTESGVNLVAILSRQPASRRLRRWLATEVLPAIRRTGSYSAGPDVIALARQLRLAGDRAGAVAILREHAGLPTRADTELQVRIAGYVGDRRVVVLADAAAALGFVPDDRGRYVGAGIGAALQALGFRKSRGRFVDGPGTYRPTVWRR